MTTWRKVRHASGKQLEKKKHNYFYPQKHERRYYIHETRKNATKKSIRIKKEPFNITNMTVEIKFYQKSIKVEENKILDRPI